MTVPTITTSLTAWLDAPIQGKQVSNVEDDLSAYLLDFSITRPTGSKDFARFSAGNATFRLDNTDGRFDVDNPDGPYYGRLGLLRRLKLTRYVAGAPTMLGLGYGGSSGTIVSDEMRGDGFQGDGKAIADGTVGLYRGVTQLVTNANFAADTVGWAKVGEAQVDAHVVGKFAGTSGRVRTAGTATGEGVELSPRVAVTAGTTYSLTCHAQVPTSRTVRVVIEWWNALSGGALVGSATVKNITADDTWQETIATGKAPVGATHAVIRYETITTAQATTFYVGGIVFAAAYDPVPFKTSDYTASLINGFSLYGLTKTNGVIILRFRSGIDTANYDASIDHYLLDWPFTGGQMRLRYIAAAGSGTLQFDRYDGAPVTGVQQSLNLSRGTWVTVILKWTATDIYMSVNGAAFTTVANALLAGTDDLGGLTLGRATDGADIDVQTFMVGFGTATTNMTNAAAAIVHTNVAAKRDPYLFNEISPDGWNLIVMPYNALVQLFSPTISMFVGYIDSIDQEWSSQYGRDIAIVRCTDFFMILGTQNLTASLAATTADAQLLEIYLQGDFINPFSTATEPAAVAPLTVAATDAVSMLARMQQLAQDSEQWFFVRNDGFVRTESRYDRTAKRMLAVIGDADSPMEIPYEALDVSFNDDFLFNDAKILPSGGSLQEAIHTESVGRYGTRPYSNTSSLLTSNARALEQAGRIVSKFATPKVRARSVTVKPIGNYWAWGLMTAEIGDRLRVIRRQHNGTTKSYDLYIDGISISGPANPLETNITYLLTESGSQGEFWIAEDATYGVVGSTTRVG